MSEYINQIVDIVNWLILSLFPFLGPDETEIGYGLLLLAIALLYGIIKAAIKRFL